MTTPKQFYVKKSLCANEEQNIFKDNLSKSS